MCGPDIRVIWPRPAPSLALAFALRGTLLRVVLQAGKLSPGAPGGQVGRKRAPPISAEPRAQGELWRVKRVDGQ